jgi:endonuclease III
MNDNKKLEIRRILLKNSFSIPPETYFPAKSQEAAKLIVSDPYAFLIACCLDRGTKVEIIWTLPYAMKIKLGHLDPFRMNDMELGEIRKLFDSLQYRPRYINDAPRTVRDLTQIVVDEFRGETSKIWEGKGVAEVKKTLRSIHGVGPGIANMTILLIEKAFPYRFSDLDRTKMDIKPDVHTRRVLFRVGASDSESDESAIEATRLMNPEFPGELDGPLWWIGRNWCHASSPDCANCPISGICALP